MLCIILSTTLSSSLDVKAVQDDRRYLLKNCSIIIAWSCRCGILIPKSGPGLNRNWSWIARSSTLFIRRLSTSAVDHAFAIPSLDPLLGGTSPKLVNSSFKLKLHLFRWINSYEFISQLKHEKPWLVDPLREGWMKHFTVSSCPQVCM